MPAHACSAEGFCFRQTLTCFHFPELELGARCAEPQGRLDCRFGVRPTNVVPAWGVETAAGSSPFLSLPPSCSKNSTVSLFSGDLLPSGKNQRLGLD